MRNVSDSLIGAAEKLRQEVSALHFSNPITHVYNPLEYAWEAYCAYVKKFAKESKRIVFLGMNPGPWGMSQTGVPFGEITAVREWMRVSGKIHKPAKEHPKRPVTGFECGRSEVSGKRLWGLFKERFGEATAFFENHFVLNYCPLVFMEESAKNRTPDKLPADEASKLYACCDTHLKRAVEALGAEWVMGVGGFAEQRAAAALAGSEVKVGRILHPSPASPAANRGWGEAATKQLKALGVWQ